MPLTNPKTKDYRFLQEMYDDDYFPNFLVDKAKKILVKLCGEIEKKKPADLEGLYKLTHAATDKINDLAAEFEDNDSEIETGARECLGADFAFIAQAYGFKDADIEALIATRDW